MQRQASTSSTGSTHVSEASALLPQRSTSLRNKTKQGVISAWLLLAWFTPHLIWWLGRLITFGAMVPQGLLAGLEGDKLIMDNKDKHAAIACLAEAAPRFVTVTALTIAGTVGKDLLVWYYARHTWENNLSKLSWWRDEFLNPKKWSLLDVINIPFTIIPSLVFAAIAKIGVDRTIVLLRGYGFDFTDGIASVLEYHLVSNILIALPFFANLVGFPFINMGGCKTLKDIAYRIVENPQYRAYRDSLIHPIQAVQYYHRDLNQRHGNFYIPLNQDNKIFFDKIIGRKVQIKDEDGDVVDATVENIQTYDFYSAFLSNLLEQEKTPVGQYVKSRKVRQRNQIVALIKVLNDQFVDNPDLDIVHLKNLVFETLKNIDYRSLVESFTQENTLPTNRLLDARGRAFTTSWNKLILENIKEFLKEINPPQPYSNNLNGTYLVRMYKLGRDEHTEKTPKSRSTIHVLSAGTTAILSTAIAIQGMVNFWDMSADAVDTIFPSVLSESEVFKYSFCAIDLTSMTLLCIGAVFMTFFGLVDAAFGYDRKINLTSTWKNIGINVLTLGILILGGLPNFFQAWLARLALLSQLTALVGSGEVELIGVYSKLREWLEGKAIKQDPAVAVASEFQKFLTLLVDEVRNFSPEQLDKFANDVEVTTERPPQYRQLSVASFWRPRGYDAIPDSGSKAEKQPPVPSR